MSTLEELHEKQQQKALERFVNSQPILKMLQVLSDSGYKNFDEDGPWEICLCALILTLEPSCKVQRILEGLPYRRGENLNEVDVLNVMAHLGYFCRPANCKMEDIDERLLPGLFIPDQGVPCIIIGRTSEDELQFYDPVSKLISAVTPSLQQGGKVWFFQRYDENRTPLSKFMRKGSGHSWFRALLGRFKGTFAQVLTAGLLLNIIALVTPLFIMMVYDRVIAAGSIGTLPMLALGAFIAIGFEWKMRSVRSRGLSWLSGRLDNIVSNKIFAHLVGLSPSLIERASVAAQIARIKTFESVRDFFSGSVFLSLLEAPFVFISVAAIALIAGPIVFVPLFMVGIYLILFWYVRKKVKISIRIAAKTSSARQQFTIETFEKLDGIRGHGLGSKWEEKFRHLSGREMMSHFDLGWLGIVAETLAHMLTVISAIATVGFGVHFIWQGELTTGALVATMILVWRILTPFYSLCTMVSRLEQLRNSIMQVNDLMDLDTEIEEAKSYSRLTKIRGAISFKNANFRYNAESDALFSDLSFDANPGDLVVVTGRNGSGKKNVLELIKALYFADEGGVYIDGFDIRQLYAPDLRRQIAYVPRVPEFFHGTIKENIRFSNPLAKEDDIVKALELADAWKDVQNLPHGPNTIMGSYRKSGITSSLACKLSLARAYLNPAPLLLIDELPNTLLAGKSGSNLKDYLARAKGKRTIVMVTYREDYMKLADTIVWMKGIDHPVTGSRDIMLNLMNGVKGEVSNG